MERLCPCSPVGRAQQSDPEAGSVSLLLLGLGEVGCVCVCVFEGSGVSVRFVILL